MNPLALMLSPFLAYGLVSQVLYEIRGRGLPEPFLRARWIQALCAAILQYGIVRILPFHPFDWLAPGAMLRP
jgi:hypothetical protein